MSAQDVLDGLTLRFEEDRIAGEGIWEQHLLSAAAIVNHFKLSCLSLFLICYSINRLGLFP